MAKQTQLKPVAEQAASASETLQAIVELVLPHRTTQNVTPTVDLIARLSGTAVRLLKLDADEATAAQNSCVLGLMRKHQLIAE